jgi:hypothetical protein
MNCKPGDLCYVVGVAHLQPPLNLALGRVVRVTHLSKPGVWCLERPIPLVWAFLQIELCGIEDHYLRPIAGPSVGFPIEVETINPLELALGITSRSYP